MRRKIADQTLIEAIPRIDAGEITQKELAMQLSVSPSALNQRIKKLKACTPPDSFEALTDKQKLFALAKVEGKSNLDAVKSAYDVTTNESGKALGTQLMSDPDVRVAIQDLMAQEGIPRRRRVKRLRDMIECPDLSVAGKGLDMSFKLAGDYAPQQIEVISDVEIRGLIAMISASPVSISETPEGKTAQAAQKVD